MKTSFFALLSAGLAALAFSCANPPENAHAHQQAATAAEVPSTENQSPNAHPPVALSLNNGQPWEANSETTEGIVHMADLTGRFVERNDPQAYQNLQASLRQEFGQIIEKCTMKGEAHNQLHHYLVPLQGYMEGLTAKDLREAEENLVQLKTHLAAYSEYFQTR